MLILADDPLLVDVFPPGDPHNISARVLRLGLSVNAFASVEKYVEDCFSRTFDKLNSCPVAYTGLPTELREFLTIKAIEGLSTRGSYVPEPDRLAYFEAHIPKVAGFGASPPIYTALGFSPRGPNVAGKDIASAFKTLKVTKPWDVLATISAAMGLSSVDLSNDFANLAKTRHRAAHNPQSNLPTGDLKNNVRAAICIGIAVDILSQMTADAWAMATKLSDVGPAIASLAFPLRFVDDEVSGGFAERASSSGRVVKRYPDEAAAVAGAATRATANFIVRRDSSSRPMALADRTVGPNAL